MKKFITPFFLFLIFCGSKSIRPMGTAELEFDRGEAFFKNHHFKKAIKGFELLIFNFPGSNLVDDAQLYVARSYLALKNFEQANLEAQFLIENFPRSEYVEEAYIIRARSLFATLPSYKRDQSRIDEAVKILEQFIENYPNSKYLDEARDVLHQCRSRLAYKLLKDGLFYKKRGDLDAAILYFQIIIDRYPEAESARAARFYLAEILEKKMKIDQARKHYKALADSVDEWGKRAKERLEGIEP